MTTRDEWHEWARRMILGSVLAGCAAEPIRKEPITRRSEQERTPFASSELGLAVRPPAPPRPAWPNECLEGARMRCPPLLLPGASAPIVGTMSCQLYDDGVWRFDNEECGTPLVVSFGDVPVVFTRPPGSFAIGSWSRTEWVSPATPWLARDLDGSGCIEAQTELFGVPSDGSGTNGFDKLSVLDDNHDGVLDAYDPAFRSLILWRDVDQDRRCTPPEVQSIGEAGIFAIELAYETPTESSLGSHEGQRAGFLFRRHREDAVARGRVVDVYLRRMD